MKHAGQGFLARGEEISCSKGAHLGLVAHSPVRTGGGGSPRCGPAYPPRASVWAREAFVFALVRRWGPTCMSKTVGPQAAAKPRPPWCVPPRPGPGPGGRLPLLCRAPAWPQAPAQASPCRRSPRRASSHSCFVAAAPGTPHPKRRGAPHPRRGEARAATHSAPPCVLLLGRRLVKKIVSMYCIFCTCLHL